MEVTSKLSLAPTAGESTTGRVDILRARESAIALDRNGDGDAPLLRALELMRYDLPLAARKELAARPPGVYSVRDGPSPLPRTRDGIRMSGRPPLL